MTTTRFVATIVVGIVQVLLAALACHSLGLDGRSWLIPCALLGAAAGWYIANSRFKDGAHIEGVNFKG